MIGDLLEKEYHMAKTLRRPTKAMMLAVNASIDGKRADANKIIKEYKLSTAELKRRIEMRDGEKYDVKKKGGRPKGSTNKKTGRAPSRGRATVSVSNAENVLQVLDGSAKIATLLKISYRANELLDAKPKRDVSKVEKAMEEAEELKRKYEEALALIGE